MGRGDKRTKRGKITMGSFGKVRPARASKIAGTTKPAEKKA
ncbi:MAG: 30S ribosomal protein THX [Sphingobacteriales bacterium]|nr:MAG: 30S ribosomal protein THX [Sphingobacteriales bacterium]